MTSVGSVICGGVPKGVVIERKIPGSSYSKCLVACCKALELIVDQAKPLDKRQFTLTTEGPKRLGPWVTTVSDWSTIDLPFIQESITNHLWDGHLYVILEDLANQGVIPGVPELESAGALEALKQLLEGKNHNVMAPVVIDQLRVHEELKALEVTEKSDGCKWEAGAKFSAIVAFVRRSAMMITINMSKEGSDGIALKKWLKQETEPGTADELRAAVEIFKKGIRTPQEPSEEQVNQAQAVDDLSNKWTGKDVSKRLVLAIRAIEALQLLPKRAPPPVENIVPKELEGMERETFYGSSSGGDPDWDDSNSGLLEWMMFYQRHSGKIHLAAAVLGLTLLTGVSYGGYRLTRVAWPHLKQMGQRIYPSMPLKKVETAATVVGA